MEDAAPTHWGHIEWCRQWTGDPRLDMPADRTRQGHNHWEKQYEGYTREINNAVVTVFTDGSRLGSRAGCGWVARRGNTTILEGCMHLGEQATVWQAEVLAISAAAGDLRGGTWG